MARNTMKLSNTFKHVRIGCIAGILSIFTLQGVDIAMRLPVAIVMAMTFFCATIAWEYYQYWHYGSKSDYWANRGWDTIMDILAANTPFILCLFIGAFGHYAGNTLRP